MELLDGPRTPSSFNGFETVPRLVLLAHTFDDVPHHTLVNGAAGGQEAPVNKISVQPFGI